MPEGEIALETVVHPLERLARRLHQLGLQGEAEVCRLALESENQWEREDAVCLARAAVHAALRVIDEANRAHRDPAEDLRIALAVADVAAIKVRWEDGT